MRRFYQSFTILLLTMLTVSGCTEKDDIEYNLEKQEEAIKEFFGEDWRETAPYMTMNLIRESCLLILNGNGTAIINWGDGAPNTHVTLSNSMYGEEIRHAYKKNTAYIITVIGQNITHLNCGGMGLRSLDVSKNPALKELHCINNCLSSLDLSGNPALTHLNAKNNRISNLDLNNNQELTFLAVYQNELTSLDLSNNVALTRLECGFNNPLSNVDLSNNIALEYLDITNFPQDFKAKWGSLDVSNNPALKTLYCSNQGLRVLNLSNNHVLTYLDCSLNNIANLDLGNNTALVRLSCNSNGLTSLDLNNNRELILLICDNNRLTSLDLENNSKLSLLLYCTNNNLQADALNALFNSLPTVTTANYGRIRIANNPGVTEAGFDKSIAEKKGWTLEYPPYW